ncbi:hypothetical protein [Mesorhizobium sp. M0322]|uniref:hypothetical protein n=1 Tax=Mesorhizobium sp. M0322 TaxID=2956937 RepID=UPI003335FE17
MSHNGTGVDLERDPRLVEDHQVVELHCALKPMQTDVVEKPVLLIRRLFHKFGVSGLVRAHNAFVLRRIPSGRGHLKTRWHRPELYIGELNAK